MVLWLTNIASCPRLWQYLNIKPHRSQTERDILSSSKLGKYFSLPNLRLPSPLPHNWDILLVRNKCVPGCQSSDISQILNQKGERNSRFQQTTFMFFHFILHFQDFKASLGRKDKKVTGEDKLLQWRTIVTHVPFLLLFLFTCVLSQLVNNFRWTEIGLT
jgi:hypothetical protein